MRNRPDGVPSTIWRLPAILASVLVLVHLAADGMLPALRYERAAVLDGEVWRLASGHVVHADLRHLGWNVLGVLIVWGLFARDYSSRQWLVVLLASTAATSLAPRSRGGPGISRSRPALTVGAVECEPNQSDITAPS